MTDNFPVPVHYFAKTFHGTCCLKYRRGSKSTHLTFSPNEKQDWVTDKVLRKDEWLGRVLVTLLRDSCINECFWKHRVVSGLPSTSTFGSILLPELDFWTWYLTHLIHTKSLVCAVLPHWVHVPNLCVSTKQQRACEKYGCQNVSDELYIHFWQCLL